MKIALAIILSLTFLSGCSTMKDDLRNQFCDYAVIPPAVPIEIDKDLLKRCADLVEPISPITYTSILTNTRDNTAIYIACKNKMDAAIVVMKKLSNQP